MNESPSPPKFIFRNDGISIDPSTIYGGSKSMFSMKFNHGGYFTQPPNRMYTIGETVYLDYIDVDHLKVEGINTIMTQLGYESDDIIYYHFRMPNKGLDNGLRRVNCDDDLVRLVKVLETHKEIEFFVELWINNVRLADLDDDGVDNIGFDLNVEDTHGQSSSKNVGDENDTEMKMEDIVDEEHIIDDVEVNMEDFVRHNVGIENYVDPSGKPHFEVTDEALEVVDYDSFDSDVGDDDDASSVIRRNLRKLKKTGGAGSDGIVNFFFVGQDFANKEEAKERIKAHAVETRRKIQIVKNDHERLQAKCNGTMPCARENIPSVGSQAQGKKRKKGETVAGGSKGNKQMKGKGVISQDEDKSVCPWKVYISPGPTCKWVVKTFNNEHKCLQSRDIKACTASFLAKHVVNLISLNPDIPTVAIQEQMQSKFQVGVSATKAFRAKSKTEVNLRGGAVGQYALLRDYAEQLKKSNPNTTVKIDVYRPHSTNDTSRRFKRIYICLGALKEGFRASGRELLGLDGAFMKGQHPGQLITAVSVDANNGIYPVAYGIVESESRDSWEWFLSCLGDDLDLYTNSNFTFITDRQKGLLPAIKSLFLAAEHRYCVRHINDNMNLIWKGGVYKERLWKCATATTMVEFERAMDELKGYNRQAHEWLRKIHPEHWSRSHFSGRAHCDLLINNICEVFNRQLLTARDSPIYTALEYVREYIMKRIVLVQKVIEKSEGPLTPSVTKLFKGIMEQASKYSVQWNGAELFEVKGPWSDKCVVNLNLRHCSCRKWEISGIPCRHAFACIFNMADNGMEVPIPEDWVHESYRLETWRNVYSHKVNPVPGPQFWERSAFNQTKLIPPYIPPQIGRPGKKRKKSVGEIAEAVKESKLTRKGGTVTCDNCLKKGHNKRSCKEPNPWKDPNYGAAQSSAAAEKGPSGDQAAKAPRQPSKTTASQSKTTASKATRKSPRKKTASQSKPTASPKKRKKTASRKNC